MVPKVVVCGAACLLFLVPACRRSGHEVAVARHAQYGTCAVLDEKRLTDVSLPVGVQAYEISQASSEEHKEKRQAFSFATTFETDLALAMLVEFYENDMERLGWKQVASVPLTSGSFLTYETPRKLCSLFIEDRGSRRDVTVFISART
jgi:hypothetical protein